MHVLHLATLSDYVMISGPFFFLLGVWFPRSKKRISEIIPGGFGNTWSYDFYIGMQNGSKLIEQIFDSCL